MKQKKIRKFQVHLYIERNLYCRAFVAAKELQETMIKCLCYATECKKKLICLWCNCSHFQYIKGTHQCENVSVQRKGF